LIIGSRSPKFGSSIFLYEKKIFFYILKIIKKVMEAKIIQIRVLGEVLSESLKVDHESTLEKNIDLIVRRINLVQYYHSLQINSLAESLDNLASLVGIMSSEFVEEKKKQ
jgi:hypothetical protein